jgi:lactate dehydrogenase-like 2-hydroxyacid dehydrogenase
MTREFNWGIIGLGRIAKKFSRAIKEIPASWIYMVASRRSKDLEKTRNGENRIDITT